MLCGSILWENFKFRFLYLFLMTIIHCLQRWIFNIIQNGFFGFVFPEGFEKSVVVTNAVLFSIRMSNLGAEVERSSVFLGRFEPRKTFLTCS